MNERSKGRCFFNGFLPVLAVLGLQNGLALFLMQFYFLLEANSFRGTSYSDFVEKFAKDIMAQGFSTVTLLSYSIFGVVLFGAWYLKFYHNHFKEAITLRGYSPILYPGIVIFAFSGQVLCSYLINAIGVLFPKLLADYVELMEKAGLSESGMTPALAIYAMILGPICEELVFRGLCYGYFRRAFSFGFACTFQAILFGAFHMNILQGIYAFLFGFALGFIMEKTGNLLVCILLHIAFNSTTFLAEASMSMVPDGAIPTFGVLLGSLILIYISIYMILHSKPFVERLDR